MVKQNLKILSDDLYLAYHEETKDAAQHRIWTFYDAINNESNADLPLSLRGV
jgi:hypothetical protein